MSNSGSGRYTHIGDLCDDRPGPEPLPDPRVAAKDAWLEVPWLFAQDVAAILAKLDERGLTICWRP